MAKRRKKKRRNPSGATVVLGIAIGVFGLMYLAKKALQTG